MGIIFGNRNNPIYLLVLQFGVSYDCLVYMFLFYVCVTASKSTYGHFIGGWYKHTVALHKCSTYIWCLIKSFERVLDVSMWTPLRDMVIMSQRLIILWRKLGWHLRTYVQYSCPSSWTSDMLE